MDRRGVAWCRANLETIVGWLREEAEKRRNAYAAALAAHGADPQKKRPKPLPWVLRLPFNDWIARWLVLYAVRRAENVIHRAALTDPRPASAATRPPCRCEGTPDRSQRSAYQG